MKKIMGISLLAVFAVSPLMARADNVNLFTAPIGVTTDVATTSYVKGAYNELGGVINTKQNQLMNSSELSLSDTVLTSVRGSEEASDRHLVTEKAVADAVAGAIGAQDFSSYATKTYADDKASAAETAAKSYTDTQLQSYTNTTGMNSAISSAVATETAARESADSALSDRINQLQSGVAGDYATKTGVAQTVNAATATGTVQIAQTWGSDATIPHTITSDVAVNGYVPGTVAQPTTPTTTEEPEGN